MFKNLTNNNLLKKYINFNLTTLITLVAGYTFLNINSIMLLSVILTLVLANVIITAISLFNSLKAR